MEGVTKTEPLENLACEHASSKDGKNSRRAKRVNKHETEEFGERSDQVRWGACRLFFFYMPMYPW